MIRALGNSYTTQGQCSAGHGCWDHEPTRAGLYAAGGSSHGVGRRLADLRAAMEAFGNAVGNTCSRLHLGGESARTCNQAVRRWRLIIYHRMKSLVARPSYIDIDQNNKTFLSYPILIIKSVMCIAHGSETVRQGCEEHLAHQPSHAGLVALSVLPALASR